jgi:hypothetical protein
MPSRSGLHQVTCIERRGASLITLVGPISRLLRRTGLDPERRDTIRTRQVIDPFLERPKAWLLVLRSFLL